METEREREKEFLVEGYNLKEKTQSAGNNDVTIARREILLHSVDKLSLRTSSTVSTREICSL